MPHDALKAARRRFSATTVILFAAFLASCGLFEPPGVPADSGLVLSGGRVYVLGGSAASGDPLAAVRSAPVLPGGALGAWRDETPLPAPRAGAAWIELGGMVYGFGGRDAAGPVGETLFAPVNADGSLGFVDMDGKGFWQIATGLPSSERRAVAIERSGRVFLVGDGVPAAELRNAAILSDRSVGPWSSGAASAPDAPRDPDSRPSVTLLEGAWYLHDAEDDTPLYFEASALEALPAPSVRPPAGPARSGETIGATALPGTTLRYEAGSLLSPPDDPTALSPAFPADGLPMDFDTDGSRLLKVRAFAPGLAASPTAVREWRKWSATFPTYSDLALDGAMHAHALAVDDSEGSTATVDRWFRLSASVPSSIRLEWLDASDDPSPYTASIFLSVVHADLQTPVPDLTGAPVFRLGADGGRSVEFTLPSGIFYVRAESADGSAGGTFGLAAARLP